MNDDSTAHLGKEVDGAQWENDCKKYRSAVRHYNQDRHHVEESHQERTQGSWDDFVDGVYVLAKAVHDAAERSSVEETLHSTVDHNKK